MNISYAAGALAYYILNGKPMEETQAFEPMIESIESSGHYTLLVLCNGVEGIDWKNPRASLDFVPIMALQNYVIFSRDWEGKTRYLKHKESGKFVVPGEHTGGHCISGGRAPQSQNSSGKVFCGDFGPEYYPSVFKMEWV